MAKIAIVTYLGTHNSVVRTKSLLESFGHTVLVFEQASATISVLRGNDLIACVRMDSGVAGSYATVAAALGEGIPVLVGLSSVTVGDISTDEVGVFCGLYAAMRSRQTRNSFRPVVQDGIFSAAGLTVGTDYQPYTSPDFEGEVPSETAVSPGAKRLAAFDTGTSHSTIVIAEKGTAKLGGGVFGASIAFCGFIYGANVTYSEQGSAVIRELVKKLTDLPYRISGVVRDSSGGFASRRIRVFRRSDGFLLGETVSDSQLGTYSVGLSSDVLCTAVCYDEDAGVENALIADRVKPTPT